MVTNESHLMAREAAEQSGKSHRQIQRLIKNGTLSATRDKSGNYLIEKSEFYRVFPETFNARSSFARGAIFRGSFSIFILMFILA